jgi:hypothetical protein
MITVGVVCLILGLLLGIPILWTVGIILLVIGLVLFAIGASGRTVGPHRYYY